MNESLQAEAERMTAGKLCVCGRSKHPDKAFCFPCTIKLPNELRRPLWGTTRQEYAVAWDEARDWLRMNG